MSYTKGKWTTIRSGIDCDDWPVAQTYPDTRKDSDTSLALMRGNAQLIAAAVNGCQAVNPDNPMAVADSIKEMHEALKELMTALENWELGRESTERDIRIAYNLAKSSLAKAEGGA